MMGVFSELSIAENQDQAAVAELAQPDDALSGPLTGADEDQPAERPHLSLVDDLLAGLEDSPPDEAMEDADAAPQPPDEGAGEAEASAGPSEGEPQAGTESAAATNTATEDEQAKRKAEDDKKRREHEEKEAQRKKEWEEAQQKKKEVEDAAWKLVLDMTDDEVASKSAVHVSSSTERLTRRNMKVCVSEHIQEKCLEDPAFARQTMHPRKNMIHCFRYITRKAKEYLEEEMKLAKEIDPDSVDTASGGYGDDVPDDLCYQWAEEYFFDMKAPEDGKKEEFKEKPYYSSVSRTTAKKPKEKRKAAPEPPKRVDEAQLTLLGA